MLSSSIAAATLAFCVRAPARPATQSRRCLHTRQARADRDDRRAVLRGPSDGDLLLVLVVRQVFSRDVFSPGWVSIGVLTWLGAAAALAGAALMWANLQTFALVLEPETVTAIVNGALTLVVAAAFFVFVGAARASGDRRGGRCGRCCLSRSPSVPSPRRWPCAAAARPRCSTHTRLGSPRSDQAERPARIAILAVDAGSLDFITSATANGRLPNFGRILDAGAVMHLATIHPTSAEAVWAAVATGKLPQKNGVRSAGSYRFPGGGDPILLLPDYCFAPPGPFWLSDRAAEHAGDAEDSHALEHSGRARHPRRRRRLAVDVSGARRCAAICVSDQYHRLIGTPAGIDDTSAIYPPELHAAALGAAEAVDAEADPVLQASSLDRRHEAPGRTDRAYDRIARELAASRPAQISIVALPEPRSDRPLLPALRHAERVRRRHRRGTAPLRVGPRAALRADQTKRSAGRFARSAPTICCWWCRATAWSRLGVLKRLLERAVGDPDLSGTHEAAPDGFLMAYGGPVVRGRLTSRVGRRRRADRAVLSSACPSAATWTATRGRTCFSRRSPRSARSRSFRRTIARAARSGAEPFRVFKIEP